VADSYKSVQGTAYGLPPYGWAKTQPVETPVTLVSGAFYRTAGEGRVSGSAVGLTRPDFSQMTPAEKLAYNQAK
jgi:hypothetical protein